MIMDVDRLICLMCHCGFYTGTNYQGHQKGVSKGIVGLYITRIGRARKIWEELFLKIRVSFDVLVSSNKVFSGSSKHI